MMLTCLTLPAAAQELSPDVLKVAHVITTNRDLLKRLKLYTCLETIERFQPGNNSHARVRDAIQLDVGVGEGREMYSWPGDASFSALDPGQLVGHGLLATGVFSGFAKDIFIANNAIVRVAGEAIVQGHRALQFSYQTSYLISQWQIQWKGKVGEVGEAGRFWVDPTDFHLLRLEVVAKDVPPQLLLQSVSLMVNYQTVGNTLVPSDASLDVIEKGGAMYHNALDFSHCHVFEAESRVLDSSEESMATVLNHYKKQQATLPPGLTLRVELDEPIEAKDAVVGNSVVAHLESAVGVSPDLVIPKGTVLHGRIRQFERVDHPANAYLVGIEFSELEWDDHDYRFLSQLVSMDTLPGMHAVGSKTPLGSSGVGLGTRRTIETGLVMEQNNSDLDGTAIPGAAVFLLTDAQSIPRGFRMSWQTRKMTR